MSKIFLAVCAVTLTLFAVNMNSSATAQAGIVAPVITLDFAGTDAEPLIQKVHGCHRFGRIGPWTGLRHRHVGPFCIWKKTGNVCKRWRRICRKRCYDARRPGRCKRRCFNNNAPPRCF